MYRLVDLAVRGRTPVINSSLLVSHAEELLSAFAFSHFSFQAYQNEPSSIISSKDFVYNFPYIIELICMTRLKGETFLQKGLSIL